MVSILGFDEVGRGSVAGPLGVGVCMLNQDFPIFTHSFNLSNKTNSSSVSTDFLENFEIVKPEGFFEVNPLFKKTKDSKQVKPEDREKNVELIIDKKIYAKYILVSNRLIDSFGIGVCLSHCLSLLLGLAVLQNQKQNQVLVFLVDGKIKLLPKLDQSLILKILNENVDNLNLPSKLDSNLDSSLNPESNLKLKISKANLRKISDLGWLQAIQNPDLFSFIDTKALPKIKIFREPKADQKFLTVALASNLAKVRRDKYMQTINQEYPEFGWDKNKGYATRQHLEVISKSIHNLNNPFLRQTFLKKYKVSL